MKSGNWATAGSLTLPHKRKNPATAGFSPSRSYRYDSMSQITLRQEG